MVDDPYRVAGPPPTLPPTKKHCFACATILDARAELCPSCGVRQPTLAIMVQPPSQIAVSSKNKTTAGIFALVLGGLGIHRFYLGQPGVGLLYILFCWTLIPAVIALVEGIQLLTMQDAEFAKRYP